MEKRRFELVPFTRRTTTRSVASSSAGRKPPPTRCVILPDQLYEDMLLHDDGFDSNYGSSRSSSECSVNHMESAYERQVRVIQENLRAIAELKFARSAARAAARLPPRSSLSATAGSVVGSYVQAPPTQRESSVATLRHPRRPRSKPECRTKCFPTSEGVASKKDATSNEAVRLQQRLRSLSSELVTLRNRLHVTNDVPTGAPLNGCHNPNMDAYTQQQPQQHQPQQSARNPADDVEAAGKAEILSVSCPQVYDLIHLSGPLTEDAVLRTLHARFFGREYFTNLGPILLSVNPYHEVGNPLTLSSVQAAAHCPQLLRVVHETVRQQTETGYPQAIILSGESGSGKTYSSMLLLRQLFDVAGGGPETDAFKHLAAAFTVLRSLGSAKTASNSESSRIGHFLEVQVTDGALYRTKIHCYFLDQTRVVRPLPNEKNYHIFYQMLAGLTAEERVKLSLDGYSLHNLCYLSRGDVTQNESEDAARFKAWKTCLSVLGIPFMDVLRVLSAVLLLGNVQFVEGAGVEVEGKSGNELKSVAALLGVSSVALFRGLTTRTHNVRGQFIKSVCDTNMATLTRNAIAKALYCRTVAIIVRRANSLKRLCSTSGTLSSDSNESIHNHTETSSQHASTIGSGGAKSSKSMTVLNSAVRHATDGFIGVLDMFGFEDSKPSQLEHLCINLCAETLQHFYNTHIFKSSIESCREESIQSDVEVDYVDNVPCIDLISSLRTGLLSMLDVECSVRGTCETYVQKVKAQHRSNKRYFDPKPLNVRLFGIRHFAGNVIYDASNFMETNRDVVPDDIVCVFHKSSCNFGFATHLFGSELKALFSQEPVPRGQSFRISPTAHTDLQNGGEPVSTLTQDFHTRLDNLLRTLVHAKPHFIRCIRANQSEQPGHFDRLVVVRQIRALQVLESVNLMAGGFPHRIRFKAFSMRYRLLAPSKKLKRTDDKAIEDCKLILEYFTHATEHFQKSSATIAWAFGKRHIFLSEGVRQQLELLHVERRHKAAVLIQALWRGWNFRRKWLTLRRNLQIQARIRGNRSQAQIAASLSAGSGANAPSVRPRPQPIAGTPPPEMESTGGEAANAAVPAVSQQPADPSSSKERPPPVPPSRPYTVSGNTKLGYPQSRVMKMNYPDDGGNSGKVMLPKGETVMVVGASSKRGHLLVEQNGQSLHVPYQFLELKATSPPQATGVNI